MVVSLRKVIFCADRRYSIKFQLHNADNRYWPISYKLRQYRAIWWVSKRAHIKLEYMKCSFLIFWHVKHFNNLKYITPYYCTGLILTLYNYTHFVGSFKTCNVTSDKQIISIELLHHERDGGGYHQVRVQTGGGPRRVIVSNDIAKINNSIMKYLTLWRTKWQWVISGICGCTLQNAGTIAQNIWWCHLLVMV